MLLQNPVQGPRIVPFGQDYLPTDVLPNGRHAFRVTQRFGDTLTVYGAHTGTDMGNFNCGDHVLAMAAGNAYAGVDGAGALYVIIDHGNGWKSFYWHLDAWVTVRQGQWTQVAAGQQIGLHGATGLGSGCHLHLEVHYNGVKRDPWPLLKQNQESGMTTFGGADFEHYFASASSKEKARVRAEPNTASAILAELPYQTPLVIHARVKGEAVGTSVTWYAIWGYWGSRYRLGYVHEVALESITPLVDGSALQTKINRAATALEGVLGSLEAGISALRTAISSLKG